MHWSSFCACYNIIFNLIIYFFFSRLWTTSSTCPWISSLTHSPQGLLKSLWIRSNANSYYVYLFSFFSNWFWVYDYGGSSIVAFTFWAEISNPFYLRRNLYKRIGMENTMKYQFFLWAYAAVFIYCRTYLFIFICKDAMESTKPPIVLKFFACLFVFISQGWFVFFIWNIMEIITKLVSKSWQDKKWGKMVEIS